MELFNPEVAVQSLGPLLAGLLITVILTLIVIVLALVLGLAVALARLYAPRWVGWIVAAYVEIIRGTPLLLQLIYIYYVLPEIGIRLERLHRRGDRPDPQLLPPTSPRSTAPASSRDRPRASRTPPRRSA